MDVEPTQDDGEYYPMDNHNDEEREHWWQVMRTFLHYSDFVEMEIQRKENHLNSLSKEVFNRLPEITQSKLDLLRESAKINQLFFDDMVYYQAVNAFVEPPSYILNMIPEDNQEEIAYILPQKEVGPKVHAAQQHRNLAVIHSLYREWSELGMKEREQSFGVILQELQRVCPVTSDNRYHQRVLVPGCGLGRLPLEIVSRGYSCEGNEYSAYMAMASNFVLNKLNEKECYEIYPWNSNICNIVQVKDTLEFIKVPDITAISLLNNQDNSNEEPKLPFPKFSMAAGNFVDIYHTSDNEGAWDVMITCFFLDTAPVVMDYIDTIYHILKPGGIWINLGPLLYHWVADVESNHDPRYDQSIELSYEELKYVMLTYGFEFLKEEWCECQYNKCPLSMMWTTYQAIQFTVRKPLQADDNSSVATELLSAEN